MGSAVRGRGAPRARARSVAPGALVVGSLGTAAAALAVDVLSGEHPTHTLALVAVVAGIAGLGRLLAAPYRGVLTVLNGAVVAQPALHLASKWVPSVGHHPTDHALPHLVPDGVTLGQIAITLLIVAVVLSCGALGDLYVGVVHAGVRWLTRGVEPTAEVSMRPVYARRRGSMLRWCGWALRAARRGPPVPAPPLVA